VNFESTVFDYLDERDSEEFENHLGTEYQDILVAGRKTLFRLEKYISEKEFYRIRVALTALVRDFNFPAIRYTSAIAITLYTMSIQDNNDVSENIKRIVEIELALLIEHLMSDSDDEGNSEKELFDKGLEKVSKHWNDYLKNPNELSEEARN